MSSPFSLNWQCLPQSHVLVAFAEKVSHALQGCADHQLPWPLHLRGSASGGLHSLPVLEASTEIGPSRCVLHVLELRAERGNSLNVLRLFITTSLVPIRVKRKDQCGLWVHLHYFYFFFK